MDRVVKASLSIDPIPAACDTASTTPSSSVVPGDTVGRAVRRLAIGGVEPDGMGTSSMHSIRRPPTSGAHRAAESVVEPDSVADDLGWKLKSAVAGRRAHHRPTLPVATAT